MPTGDRHAELDSVPRLAMEARSDRTMFFRWFEAIRDVDHRAPATYPHHNERE